VEKQFTGEGKPPIAPPFERGSGGGVEVEATSYFFFVGGLLLKKGGGTPFFGNNPWLLYFYIHYIHLIDIKI
jgi:hypothetical protein